MKSFWLTQAILDPSNVFMKHLTSLYFLIHNKLNSKKTNIYYQKFFPRKISRPLPYDLKIQTMFLQVLDVSRWYLFLCLNNCTRNLSEPWILSFIRRRTCQTTHNYLIRVFCPLAIKNNTFWTDISCAIKCICCKKLFKQYKR